MAKTTHGAQAVPFAHPLSQVRAERGWTYQQLVNVIARRVGNMAAHRDKAYRWEHCGVVPEVDAQLALAAELGISAETVRVLGWPSWLVVAVDPNTELPWTASNCLAILHQTAGAAMFDRRGFFTLSAGAVATVANQWLTAEPQRLTAALHGGRVGTALVGMLERRASDLRHMLGTLGGETVQALADAELRTVTTLLADASYPEQVGDQLFALSADLGRVAGYASFNTGHHAAGERYYLAALRAAHTADDRLLGANILGEMSKHWLESDRPKEALALASSARASARHAPPRVTAMLGVRQARAYGLLGQEADCERLLAAAETAMSHADDQPAPEWADWLDEGFFCFHVGRCYTELTRYQTAERWHTRCHELRPGDGGVNIDLAELRLWHADTVLRLGDVEHACALASEAVPSVAVARSARHRHHLAELHTRLNQHLQIPAVAALDEQIRTLIPSAA